MAEYSRYVSLRDLLKDQPSHHHNKQTFLVSPSSSSSTSSSSSQPNTHQSTKTPHHDSAHRVTHETFDDDDDDDELNLAKGSSSIELPPFLPSSLHLSHGKINKKNCSSAAKGGYCNYMPTKLMQKHVEEKNAAFEHEEIKILPHGVMYVSRQNGRLKLNITYHLAEGVDKEDEEEQDEDEEEEVELMAVAVTA